MSTLSDAITELLENNIPYSHITIAMKRIANRLLDRGIDPDIIENRITEGDITNEIQKIAIQRLARKWGASFVKR